MTEVIEVTRDDLRWNLGDGTPTAKIPGGRTEVDPFPCYPHDLDLVRATLADVEAAARLPMVPAAIYVLHVEALSRTNGWASPEYEWDEDAGKWDYTPGTIVLSGKRIPLHPAMTRYLVSHEYGHHVEYAISKARGLDPHQEELREEYAKIRRLDAEECMAYGGGLWHTNVGELFANDFRILVAEQETEFWPHPGFTRPQKLKGVQRFWSEVGF